MGCGVVVVVVVVGAVGKGASGGGGEGWGAVTVTVAPHETVLLLPHHHGVVSLKRVLAPPLLLP